MEGCSPAFSVVLSKGIRVREEVTGEGNDTKSSKCDFTYVKTYTQLYIGKKAAVEISDGGWRTTRFLPLRLLQDRRM